MNSFQGLSVFESTFLPLKWQVKRVHGGYMNRWLIRVEVPVFQVFYNEMAGAFYVHPLNMPALREAMAAAGVNRRPQKDSLREPVDKSNSWWLYGMRADANVIGIGSMT